MHWACEHSRRSQRRIWRGDGKRYSGHEQHYPRQARIAPGAGATHHACPAWSPCWGGEQSSLGGQGRQQLFASSTRRYPNAFFLFFSRALGKASRAQQPHKTRRLIRLLPPNPRRAASHTNSPPPPGKPAGANGHTRRTASFHTPSGTCRPKGGQWHGRSCSSGSCYRRFNVLTRSTLGRVQVYMLQTTFRSTCSM